MLQCQKRIVQGNRIVSHIGCCGLVWCKFFVTWLVFSSTKDSVMAGKEAVVFIIDSNVTMNMTYPKGQSDKLASDGASSPMDSDIKGKTTRLECAKKVVQTLICNLMVQSKSNEACVVVLKTSSTKHHLHDSSSDEDADAGEDVSPQFRNITLLSGDGSGSSTGLARPNPTLLRQIDEIQSATTSSNVTPSSLRGDFLDGLIIASDALRNRTKGKKYRRRIILITDAEHEVVGKNEIFQIIDRYVVQHFVSDLIHALSQPSISIVCVIWNVSCKLLD